MLKWVGAPLDDLYTRSCNQLRDHTVRPSGYQTEVILRALYVGEVHSDALENSLRFYYLFDDWPCHWHKAMWLDVFRQIGRRFDEAILVRHEIETSDADLTTIECVLESANRIRELMSLLTHGYLLLSSCLK